MKIETDRYSDIMLERFLLGELPADKMEAIRLQSAGDESLRRRLEELQRSDAEFLTRYPAREQARKIIDKAEVRMPIRAPRRRFIPIMALAGAAAAACLVLLLALPAGSRAHGFAGTDTTDVIRYKGDSKFSSPSLSIYRLRGDDTELLKDKAVVRPRDVIQVRYNALAKKYGAILSIDGRGSVTLHSPVPPSTEVALDHPEALLARSFELDDAPDFEIFFFVTADSPFDLSLIQDRAKKLALAGKAAVNRELDLPGGLTQTSFLLIKEIK